MKTSRENNGYTTSYAQIRVHHGTHADFPPHVGLDGGPKWNLSGQARICSKLSVDDYRPVMLFDIGEAELPDDTISELLANGVEVVGTSHTKVGDLEAHKRLLGNGVVVVENLTNLDAPPTSVGYVHCFALTIERCADGAPVTVAFEPNSSSEP